VFYSPGDSIPECLNPVDCFKFNKFRKHKKNYDGLNTNSFFYCFTETSIFNNFIESVADPTVHEE